MVVLIYSPLRINDVEFHCLLVLGMSTFVMWLSKLFAHFLNWIVFFFYWKKEKLEEIEKRKHWIVLQVYLMNVFCKDLKNLDIISQISIFVSEAVKVWVA